MTKATYMTAVPPAKNTLPIQALCLLAMSPERVDTYPYCEGMVHMGLSDFACSITFLSFHLLVLTILVEVVVAL